MVRTGMDGKPKTTWHPGSFEVIDKHGRRCVPHLGKTYTMDRRPYGPRDSSHLIPAPWLKTSSVNQNPTEGLTMLPIPTHADLEKSASTYVRTSHSPYSSVNGDVGNQPAKYAPDTNQHSKGRARNEFTGWEKVGRDPCDLLDWPSRQYTTTEAGSS